MKWEGEVWGREGGKGVGERGEGGKWGRGVGERGEGETEGARGEGAGAVTSRKGQGER